MSRYSLNLRPKYGRDEPTGGEGVARGIVTALDEIQKYRDADRTEQNTMAAAGATRLPPGPNDSVGGRVRSIGKAIGGLFGRGDEAPVVAPAGTPGATPPFAPTQPRQPITGTGGIVPPRIDPATLGGMAGNPRPQTMAPGLAQPAPDLVPAAGMTPHMPATAATNAVRPSISAALNEEIKPYTYEGVHGAKYQVDPLYGARVKAAGEDFGDERKIQALVDAGMDPKEARARVLNNVVRYDEQFGQQSRSRGAISPEEWTRRQDKLQADRKELEQMRQQGKETSREYQQKALQLRQDELEARRDAAANNLQFRAGTEEVRSNKEPGPFEKDPNEPPGAASERARGRAKGRQMQQAAVTDAQRRANGGTGEAVKARARARAQQLQRQGMDRAKIAETLRAEGYRVEQ